MEGAGVYVTNLSEEGCGNDKADFLQLLERALAQLPERSARANLEYYSELLDDMLEEGMTEAEATAKLGSPSQIAQSILQEVPLGKLVSTRMKPKSGWTPLAIVLAVVGSPVWVPLLLLAAALVLSLFVSIWALGVAAVAVVVGLAVAVVAAPILAIRAAVLTLPLGLLLLGGGLVLLGLCVLGGLMAVELCKLLWQLTVWLAHKIKGLFIRKEENL